MSGKLDSSSCPHLYGTSSSPSKSLGVWQKQRDDSKPSPAKEDTIRNDLTLKLDANKSHEKVSGLACVRAGALVRNLRQWQKFFGFFFLEKGFSTIHFSVIHFPSLFQCFFAVSSCLSVHFAGVTQTWKTQQLARSWLAIRLLDTLSTSPCAFQAAHLILAKERSFQGVGWWWPENDGLYFSRDVEDDLFLKKFAAFIDQ